MLAEAESCLTGTDDAQTSQFRDVALYHMKHMVAVRLQACNEVESELLEPSTELLVIIAKFLWPGKDRIAVRVNTRTSGYGYWRRHRDELKGAKTYIPRNAVIQTGSRLRDKLSSTFLARGIFVANVA